MGLEEKNTEFVDPRHVFSNGRNTSHEYIRIMIKDFRLSGMKRLNAEFLDKLFKRFKHGGQKFEALCVLQFMKAWQIEFGNVFDISMGQVDLLMRKYFK